MLYFVTQLLYWIRIQTDCSPNRGIPRRDNESRVLKEANRDWGSSDKPLHGEEGNPVGQGWHRPQNKCLSAPSRGVTARSEQKPTRKEKQETNILGQ